MVEPDDILLDEALPLNRVLEAYAVPDLPIDFTDRVMASLHPSQVPLVVMKPSRAPWIVAALTSACAIAAVVALVLIQGRPPLPETPTPAVAPEVAAPPVAMVAPAVAPATGDLVIEAVPHDAIVRIDGTPISETAGGSPFVRTNLAIGPHLVEVERDGYLPWQREIDVPARALHLDIELRATDPPAPVNPAITFRAAPTRRVLPRRATAPASSSSGSPDLKDPFGSRDVTDPWAHGQARLSIRADEGIASIRIDGKLIGTTPIVRHMVTAGSHVITWEWSDGRIVEKHVDVEDRVDVLLDPR